MKTRPDFTALLDQNSKLPLMPIAEFKRCDPVYLRLFCHYAARYLLPTVELVQWLDDYIDGRSAIEIGAGCGDLGYHLGISMYDNYNQTWPDVREIYTAMQQPLIQYGQDVIEMDALEAAEKLKPDVIIGGWVTQWVDPKLPPPPGGGSMYGIKERELLEHCNEYIVVGCTAVHGGKFIMDEKPTIIDASDFVVSRSQRGDDKIYIFKGRKSE